MECQTPLIGRIDKKFCNDMCRNSYNNNINKDANEYVRKVNVILFKQVSKHRLLLLMVVIYDAQLDPHLSPDTAGFQLYSDSANFYGGN